MSPEGCAVSSGRMAHCLSGHYLRRNGIVRLSKEFINKKARKLEQESKKARKSLLLELWIVLGIIRVLGGNWFVIRLIKNFHFCSTIRGCSLFSLNPAISVTVSRCVVLYCKSWSVAPW